MTVQELIDMLNEVEDKTLDVYVYYSGNQDLNRNGNLAYIQMIDDQLGSRVDINCTD